ncbi:hypothetical protein AYI68_g8323 [Smittium mucronatum]|uniref:Uncharacterized protein n=1 Tax=Smittium mucronatum TaxID=133383 RepID=A0A1R0GL74_9FUNG|nr:hypothetical protein AYI68_g8323 [Smittium mucronatum]
MGLVMFSMFAAVSMQIVSVFGAIFLALMGFLFTKKVSEFTESIHDPDDPIAVGRACYSAAIIYAVMFLFCSCQVYANKRQARNQLSL